MCCYVCDCFACDTWCVWLCFFLCLFVMYGVVLHGVCSVSVCFACGLVCDVVLLVAFLVRVYVCLCAL